MKDFIASLLSDKPHIGILASMTGLFTAILSSLHIITIVFGLLGAIFGAAAGFYTFLIKKKEWRDASHKHKKSE